jgi:phosphatidylglycerophosphate synthase
MTAFADGRIVAGQALPSENDLLGVAPWGGDRSADRTLAQCYGAAKKARGGGFLYSRTISDWLGTALAAVAMRLGAHPTQLTLANLVLGVGGSAAVVAGSHRMLLLVIGAVLWQLAYVFDCADGQLARATGKTSAFGAAVDVLVDVAVQISVVVAVAGVILARGEIPGVWVVLFAASWCVNFVTFLLTKTNEGASYALSSKTSPVMSIAKLLRDYGFAILVLGAWLVFRPSSLFIPAMALTGFNLLVLVGYIARNAALSFTISTTPTSDHERGASAGIETLTAQAVSSPATAIDQRLDEAG